MNMLLTITGNLVEFVTIISLAAISVSLVLLTYRIITGPINADRAVTLDSFGMNMMGLTALVAIIIPTTKLNDVVLLIGILLFIGTLGAAKYLEKGVSVDRDVD